MILVDAGPLVALIHADDNHHQRCTEAFRAVDEPMVTVWPAVTEAMYLLAFSWQAQEALWDFLEREVLTILPLEMDDLPGMHELMAKYQDLPMDFADAALVRVAERQRIGRIFTVDYRDFSVYRPNHIKSFIIIPGP